MSDLPSNFYDSGLGHYEEDPKLSCKALTKEMLETIIDPTKFDLSNLGKQRGLESAIFKFLIECEKQKCELTHADIVDILHGRFEIVKSVWYD